MNKKEALAWMHSFRFSLLHFCFAAVLWLKRGESKYRLDKTKLVDGFIEENNIDVAKFYSGHYCDLVLDTTNRSVWFFVLEQLTLKYKHISFDDLFYVALKYDGHPIDAYRREGQMRRDARWRWIKKS